MDISEFLLWSPFQLALRKFRLFRSEQISEIWRNQALIWAMFIIPRKEVHYFHWALSTTHYEEQRFRFTRISVNRNRYFNPMKLYNTCFISVQNAWTDLGDICMPSEKHLKSLGIWHVITEVSLELEVQVWTLQDTTFASINVNKDFVKEVKYTQEWNKI